MTDFDKGLHRRDVNYVPLTPLDFIARAAEVYGNRPAVVHGSVVTLERVAAMTGSTTSEGVSREP